MPTRLLRAWLDSPSSGVVELDRNWEGLEAPPVALGPGGPALVSLLPAPARAAAATYRYLLKRPDRMLFLLPVDGAGEIDPKRDRVYLAGDFNGWDAAGRPEWELLPARLGREKVLLWSGPAEKFLSPPGQRFKFVTGERLWLGLPDDAPNAVRDPQGNLNRRIDPFRTGRHLWRFTLAGPIDLAEIPSISLAGGPAVPLAPGDFFYELATDLPLGALVRGEETVFRLFAPRARRVILHVGLDAARPDEAHAFDLARRADAPGVWEVTLDQNLHAWFYWYALEGAAEGPGPFDPSVRVLDPYALATVDRGGPGIVLEREWIGRGDRSLRTPAWQDLVIAEGHVRDLAANAPVEAGPEERLGFTGLRRWVESPNFYLHRLGVNCVELQPVLEFDNRTREEYHWGYMPNSFFAPESSYSLAPAGASGVRELQALVAACHRRGLAVILDVVYNHVGQPAHLQAIDRLYYFEQDAEGRLANWSGCGNDLRAGSAMARRMIVDSCLHLLEAYGVDGFRFDLAELLGLSVLREVEAALKRVRPSVILVAEPWSFRGHIAGRLRDTGYASWNDGYRDFVRDYVLGRGEAARLEYFLRGSPWYFARWPAQTVNYTESHDDHAWIDRITVNPGGDGFDPAPEDRRRTHLMAAILFMSLGIPMIAAGQDFLRSKRGEANTYRRGDLNALDYRRLQRYLGTHAYFADWIAFRRGPWGRLLRHYSRPGEGFFRFFSGAGPALAALYNADGSHGPARLLFAVNPAPADAVVPLGEAAAGPRLWREAADQERFYERNGAAAPLERELLLPPLSCALWLSGE